MADEVKKMRGAIQHALVVLEPGKLDLTTASEETLEILRTMIVNSAIEDLKLTDLTEAQRRMLYDAARTALDFAIRTNQRRGVTVCVFPEEE